MTENYLKILQITADHLEISTIDIKADMSFIDDLGADSLDTVLIVMAFEEEFGQEIDDHQAGTITTLQDAADLITRLQQNPREDDI
jgi:acyl carrier protein